MKVSILDVQVPRADRLGAKSIEEGHLRATGNADFTSKGKSRTHISHFGVGWMVKLVRIEIKIDKMEIG